jgi:hypothetical protein
MHFTKMAAAFAVGLIGAAGGAFAQPAPRLHYTFDEASSGSGTATDRGAQPPADGTFIDGATRVGETPGGFSRAAADLTAPPGLTHGPAVTTSNDADKLDAPAALTLTMWINLRFEPSRSLKQNLILDMPAFPPPEGSGGWELNLSAAGPGERAANFTILLLANQGDTGRGLSARGLNADHQWLFVAATKSDAGLFRLYSATETTPVGLLNSGQLGPTQHVIPGNDVPMYVGGMPGNGFAPPMWVDDVRVYDVALAQSDLEQVRLANLPEPGTGLVLAAAAALAALPRRRRRRRRA